MRRRRRRRRRRGRRGRGGNRCCRAGTKNMVLALNLRDWDVVWQMLRSNIVVLGDWDGNNGA